MTPADRKSSNLPALNNPKDLQEFLHEPLTNIVAAITSALAMGRPDFVLAAGRILQAGINKKLFEQVAREIQLLIKKGKLKEDYASEPLGYKSLLELLQLIDSEAPDDERLRGMQAMFFAVNDISQVEAQRTLNYQVFQIAKQLSGSQIRLVVTLTKTVGDPRFTSNDEMDPARWAGAVAGLQGHNLSSLIEVDEEILVKYKLISPRRQVPPTAQMPSQPPTFRVNVREGRLTDLGARLAWCLQRYDQIKKEIEPQQ